MSFLLFVLNANKNTVINLPTNAQNHRIINFKSYFPFFCFFLKHPSANKTAEASAKTTTKNSSSIGIPRYSLLDHSRCWTSFRFDVVINETKNHYPAPCTNILFIASIASLNTGWLSLVIFHNSFVSNFAL